MKDEKDEDSDLDPQTQADRLEERLIDFAVRIIKLSNRLRIVFKELKTSIWY
jgi:hypothetical protein